MPYPVYIIETKILQQEHNYVKVDIEVQEIPGLQFLASFNT